MLMLAACDNCRRSRPPPNPPRIKVRSAEQDRLHKLDALNLAIGLKRAIYDAGYSCKRITDAGFVADIQESRHVGGALLTTEGSSATGRSSPGRTAARRFATARTFPAAAFPNV